MPNQDDSDQQSHDEPERLRVSVTQVADGAAIELGEHDVHHACHLGDGWLELRTSPSATPARVRVRPQDVPALAEAGFLSSADIAALSRAQ